MTVSLHTLPVELVYCVMDHLDDKAMFLSLRNVCKNLNHIMDTYQRYQVQFFSLRKVVSSPLYLHFYVDDGHTLSSSEKTQWKTNRTSSSSTTK